MTAGPAIATTANGISVAMVVKCYCDTIFTKKLHNCTNKLQDWIKSWNHGHV